MWEGVAGLNGKNIETARTPRTAFIRTYKMPRVMGFEVDDQSRAKSTRRKAERSHPTQQARLLTVLGTTSLARKKRQKI